MKKYVKIKIFVELQCYPKRIIYYNLINICTLKLRTLFMLLLKLQLKKIDRCANNPEIFNVNNLGI